MLPKVVIVGRPNVGKSSLLNMLANRRVSIVDPTPGVTRDRVATIVALPQPITYAPQERNRKARLTAKEKALAKVQGNPIEPPAPHKPAEPDYIELIDTGGYGIEDSQNLTADVERQIAMGMADAQLILFLVDVQTGILPLDKEVARMLRNAQGKEPRPVLLIANKVDSDKLAPAAAEASRLGFGEPLLFSATTGNHREELIAAIRSRIDWNAPLLEKEKPDLGVLLAIVGKRNAGKSTLVNALAGQERVIVSEIEGTTRDSVDVRFEIEGKVFTAIDTAGLRKGKSLAGDIEYYSQHRALRTVRRADVVLLIIDSTVPISNVDEKLSTEIQRQFKPVVIVVNKWDLAQDEAAQETYIEYLDKALNGLDYAPVAFVSAKEKQGMRELAAMALNLQEQARHRVPTAELNETIEAIIAERPPSSGVGRAPRIYYATQLETQPPTIALFVNIPAMFDPSYQRFLINRFRERLPFSEVPMRLLIRGKNRVPEEGKSEETKSQSRGKGGRGRGRKATARKTR